MACTIDVGCNVSVNGYLKSKRQDGFSLVELMIVLIIVAVLATLAGPSFRESIERNRRLFAMEDTLALLTHARSEAVARSAPVHVCPSADQQTCIAGSNVWTPGIIAFADDGSGSGTESDGVLSGDEELIRVAAGFGSGIDLYGPDPVTSSGSAIVFDEDGGAELSGTIQICDRNGPASASAIVMNVSGQLRIALDEDNNGTANDSAGDVTCD